MSSRLCRVLTIGFAIVLAAAYGRAADIASDSAGDSAYNTGWTSGSNGGYGWGGGWQMHPWNIDFQSILGDSTTNGHGDPDADGDINSPRARGGRAWGVVDGYAVRPFSAPLSVGQTFSIDLDDHASRQYGLDVNLAINTPDGSDALVVFADQFDDPANMYAVSYRTGFSTRGYLYTGVPLTDQGIHLAFTQSSSGVRLSLTPHLPGATTTTLDIPVVSPYSGQLASVEFNAFGSPPPNGVLNSYINNMAITPEPSSLASLTLALFALLARQRLNR